MTHGYQVESWSLIDDWQLLDQSANGVRLQRPLKVGVRVGSGQLIAIKLGGSTRFMVGGVEDYSQLLLLSHDLRKLARVLEDSGVSRRLVDVNVRQRRNLQPSEQSHRERS